MDKPSDSLRTTNVASSWSPTGSELPYQPRDPQTYRPAIGLVGCGAITEDHLTAYRQAGYNVVALCDLDHARAAARQKEFYPDAQVLTDYRQLLGRDDIQVVDIATHPPVRAPIIEAAIRAGKHVLSQKPFVLDLDQGQRLVELADKHNVYLAVNQNGRWAPHFSYIRHAIAAGILGQVSAAHLAVHWDHSWVAGTEFEKVKHLILYDFAIHWFDILRCFFPGQQARRVYASLDRSPVQTIRPPLLAQALVQFDRAQASLVFDGDTRFGPLDTPYVEGSLGTIHSAGPDLKSQQLALYTAEGVARPTLQGCWFPDGFHGTMGELLCAIEEHHQPMISAAANLDSLALCFVAVASSQRHEAVEPGTVRQLPS